MKELTFEVFGEVYEKWHSGPPSPLDESALQELYRLLTEAEERKGVNVETGHWWCPACKEAVIPQRVTNQENHDTCGHPVEWVEFVKDAPTPDRKASVLAGALQLGQGQVAFEGLEGMDKELIADCTVEVSLAIHDAVDRAFEGGGK